MEASLRVSLFIIDNPQLSSLTSILLVQQFISMYLLVFIDLEAICSSRTGLVGLRFYFYKLTKGMPGRTEGGKELIVCFEYFLQLTIVVVLNQY